MLQNAVGGDRALAWPGLKMSATLAVWQSVSLSDCLPQAGVAPN